MKLEDSRRNWIDGAFTLGLGLLVGGVGCWSIPGACVVAGVVLIAVAGLGARYGC